MTEVDKTVEPRVVGEEQSTSAQLVGEVQAKPENPNFKWYILNTYSGSEESVKLALLENIRRCGLEQYFGKILVPKIAMERVLKSGKRKTVDKTSYPGYIIAQMEMNEHTMHCVASTPKVSGFVGNRKKPHPMSEQDVYRILNPDDEFQKKADAKVMFEKGEAVKVIDGPFTNFDGVIEEVKADKMKLRVLVSIFGRETPVELGYSQVNKLT